MITGEAMYGYTVADAIGWASDLELFVRTASGDDIVSACRFLADCADADLAAEVRRLRRGQVLTRGTVKVWIN